MFFQFAYFNNIVYNKTRFGFADYLFWGGSEMLFAKNAGNWKTYESMKKDDYSVNEKYWKKYKGITKELAQEIPKEKLYDIIDNYVFWIVKDSFDEELDKKLAELPEILRYSYLIYQYECEINNGGFDQFFFNSIGYEVFEIQKALEYFGLIKNKEILDKAIELLKTKIDLKDYKKLSASRDLPTEEIETELQKLDSLFYKYPEKIMETVNSVIDKNRDKIITN